MDSKRFRISLPLLVFGTAVILFFRFGFTAGSNLAIAKNLLISCFSSFLLYFSIYVLTGEELNFSDIAFGIFSALYTGFYLNIVSAIFAALVGMLYYLLSASLQKFKKTKNMHRPIFAIPFVPFITAGSVLSKLLFQLF
ncbi:MAG: hypothetical protein IJ727_03805 [Treponema sp.]|nr:hypothetical protein [Treponema sp.]